MPCRLGHRHFRNIFRYLSLWFDLHRNVHHRCVYRTFPYFQWTTVATPNSRITYLVCSLTQRSHNFSRYSMVRNFDHWNNRNSIFWDSESSCMNNMSGSQLSDELYSIFPMVCSFFRINYCSSAFSFSWFSIYLDYSSNPHIYIIVRMEHRWRNIYKKASDICYFYRDILCFCWVALSYIERINHSKSLACIINLKKNKDSAPLSINFSKHKSESFSFILQICGYFKSPFWNYLGLL